MQSKERQAAQQQRPALGLRYRHRATLRIELDVDVVGGERRSAWQEEDLRQHEVTLCAGGRSRLGEIGGGVSVADVLVPTSAQIVARWWLGRPRTISESRCDDAETCVAEFEWRGTGVSKQATSELPAGKPPG